MRITFPVAVGLSGSSDYSVRVRGNEKGLADIMYTCPCGIHSTDTPDVPSPYLLSCNVYPLPDESTLIRKGGNGEIYKGDYAGITFAVKKTIFRQREYRMKLHHRNIMPLLLLMIGEAHPLHKRRVFSYHVMPHMSGGCGLHLLFDIFGGRTEMYLIAGKHVYLIKGYFYIRVQ